MKLGELFDNIILCAQEGKTLYELNAEVECFARLDEVVKTIGVLRDFYEKYESLRTQSRIGAYPSDHLGVAMVKPRGRKRKNEDELDDPVVDGRSDLLMQSLQQRRKKKIGEGLDAEVSDQEVQAAFGDVQENIDKELRVKLDRILLSFLEKICTDENCADALGNKIHLNFSERHKNSKTFKEGLYIPFRFRIQALVNAFHEEVKRSAILPDDEHLPKLIKEYLWSNRFIKRFNEENKKLKIKGNHIWMVEAANTIRGRWIFREYARKFLTEPPVNAIIGQRYIYAPKVWDPEIADPQVFFSSNHLPHWLQWSNNVLSGSPDETAEDCDIKVIATIFPPGKGKRLRESVRTLEQSFKIRVTVARPGDVHEQHHHPHHHDPTDPGEEVDDVPHEHQ